MDATSEPLMAPSNSNTTDYPQKGAKMSVCTLSSILGALLTALWSLVPVISCRVLQFRLATTTIITVKKAPSLLPPPAKTDFPRDSLSSSFAITLDSYDYLQGEGEERLGTAAANFWSFPQRANDHF